MRTSAIAAAIIALTLAAGVARADVITTYTLSGVTTSVGGTITGSFMIDQTTTGFVGGTITVSGITLHPFFDGTYSFLEFDPTKPDNVLFDNNNSLGVGLDITIGSPPITSGSISDTGIIEDTSGNSASVNGTTTASTPSAVPEPASLALLGTALVGLGVIRRRRRT